MLQLVAASEKARIWTKRNHVNSLDGKAVRKSEGSLPYRGSGCKYKFVPCSSISVAILLSVVGYNQVTISSLGEAQEKTGTRGT
jgi:hypothetical protein